MILSKHMGLLQEGAGRTDAGPHSHQPIGKVGLLDRSVQMQLIKRGGPKGGPKVGSHEEADRSLRGHRINSLGAPGEKLRECRLKAPGTRTRRIGRRFSSMGPGRAWEDADLSRAERIQI